MVSSLTPPDSTSPSSPITRTVNSSGTVLTYRSSLNCRFIKLLVAPESIRVYAYPIGKFT